MAQNGPKQPKMPPNGLKCLAKWSKWGKEYQHQIIWPKMAENCQKWSKNGQNDLKMAKNDPKCFFKVIFIDNLKSGLHSEGFN